MTQAYSNPERENEPHALPDVEVFYHDELNNVLSDDGFADGGEEYTDDELESINKPSGWYWWTCFPGCLPDGDAIGPFDTEAEALANAQSNND